MSDTNFIDRQCDAYEAEWQGDSVPNLADWLKGVPGEPSTELLVNLLKVDLEYRLQSDPELDVDNYVKPFGINVADLKRSTSDDVTETATSVTDTMHHSPESIAPPQQIARFRIQREIGRGGFGRVYLARDETLNRDVALKVPRALPDAETKRRFMREAEAAASLDHAGIVRIYEAGDWGGETFIASAFCPGQNLSQWLKSQASVPCDICADIVRRVAEAIQHAHSRGVVHRDLKPSNVMLVPVEGEPEQGGLPFVPRVTDFGMAKLVKQRLEDTHSSVMLGTPCYMAPELFEDESDAEFPFAADIYAVGVILYESMTGQRPHEGKSIVHVMDAVREGAFQPPSELRSSISADLETICLKCLHRNPADRYDSCGALAEDLSRFLRRQPINARRPALKDKLKSWLSSPARVYETGLLSMLVGAGVPGWVVAMILFVWKDGLEASVGAELIPQGFALCLFVLFPQCLAGYKILQGSRLWMWVGWFFCLISLFQVVPPLFGVNVVFAEMYERYPLGRIVAYSCLSLLYLLQLAQYAIILRYATPAKP